MAVEIQKDSHGNSHWRVVKDDAPEGDASGELVHRDALDEAEARYKSAVEQLEYALNQLNDANDTIAAKERALIETSAAAAAIAQITAVLDLCEPSPQGNDIVERFTEFVHWWVARGNQLVFERQRNESAQAKAAEYVTRARNEDWEQAQLLRAKVDELQSQNPLADILARETEARGAAEAKVAALESNIEAMSRSELDAIQSLTEVELELRLTKEELEQAIAERDDAQRKLVALEKTPAHELIQAIASVGLNARDVAAVRILGRAIGNFTPGSDCDRPLRRQALFSNEDEEVRVRLDIHLSELADGSGDQQTAVLAIEELARLAALRERPSRTRPLPDGAVRADDPRVKAWSKESVTEAIRAGAKLDVAGIEQRIVGAAKQFIAQVNGPIGGPPPAPEPKGDA